MSTKKTPPRPPWHPSMSDGCSVPEIFIGLMPEGICELCRPECEEHDEAFYIGGSEADFHLANTKFYAGILPKIGEHWATEWYGAVNTLGWSHWGTGRAWDGRLLWEKVAKEQQSP